MPQCVVVIMAAGEGKRMKSQLPKVLHKAAGKPLVGWVCDTALEATGVRPVVILGRGADQVRAELGEAYSYAFQPEQHGTGHAVMCAKEQILAANAEYTVIMSGDSPLIRAQSIAAMIEQAKSENADALLLTGYPADPTGYGRVIRNSDGGVTEIAEHKDCAANRPELLSVREINLGFYCFRTSALMEALTRIQPNNAQGEYYLTDCISVLHGMGRSVGAMVIDDIGECDGVNDRAQLARAAKVLRTRINEALMVSGVTMIDPESTYIDAGVRVDSDAVIYPGVILEGKTEIGTGAVLYQGSRIANSSIGAYTSVQNSVILESTVGEHSVIGPYAWLRPGTHVGSGCRVGDFVECKNSDIKDGAKVSHLTYIGDGEIGEGSNIGCGVVFVNYDGKQKERTVVGKHCFIGCNTNLIAPVSVGDGAYIAAGATVTKDVPADALCIARAKQLVKEGWGKGRFK